MLHTFADCDTVSLFKSIGTNTAWQWWNSFDDATAGFLSLISGPTTVSKNTAGLLKRYVILLHNKTSMKTVVY